MKIGDLFRKQSQTKAFPSQDNVSFYQLEPEVAGGWGEDTVADTTMQPPRSPTKAPAERRTRTCR